MTVLAVDTSVAVPFLMAGHNAHTVVKHALRDRQLALTAHSLAETYSVLTRLPGSARVELSDAVAALDANFGTALLPKPSTMTNIAAILAQHHIAGGAVYDALVALAARDHGASLVSRDARAVGTYRQLGVDVEVVAG